MIPVILNLSIQFYQETILHPYIDKYEYEACFDRYELKKEASYLEQKLIHENLKREQYEKEIIGKYFTQDQNCNLFEYTTTELESWATYGNPRAFYEQKYSFDVPNMKDENGIKIYPKELRISDVIQWEAKNLPEIKISRYTKNMIRNSNINSNKRNNSSSNIRGFFQALESYFPHISLLIESNIREKLYNKLKKLHRDKIGCILAKLSYYIAQNNGIYVEFWSICNFFQIPIQSLDYSEISNSLGITLTSRYMVLQNLLMDIINQVYSFSQLQLISIEKSQQVREFLIQIDPLKLPTITKFASKVLSLYFLKKLGQTGINHLVKREFPDKSIRKRIQSRISKLKNSEFELYIDEMLQNEKTCEKTMKTDLKQIDNENE